jgi:hypothetical protein
MSRWFANNEISPSVAFVEGDDSHGYERIQHNRERDGNNNRTRCWYVRGSESGQYPS